MLLSAFILLSPRSSWQQRLCLAHQVWNLLECQQWHGLTCPVHPNVFLQGVCSLWISSINPWWWLCLMNLKQPWLNFTACPVFCSLMTLLKSGLILSFLHVTINNNIFLIIWQVLFFAYKKLLLSPECENFSCFSKLWECCHTWWPRHSWLETLSISLGEMRHFLHHMLVKTH